ncbi:MAG TPA: hypothetical protein ACFCUY_06625 [Xenococcaceae cyanobacterium]
MNTETILEIKPKNSRPQGGQKILWYFMLGLGLISFPFGGFILFAFGVYVLFINPKKVQRDYPISYKLTNDELIAYDKNSQVAWRIPWQDIDSIYSFSNHWSVPKSLALVLKRRLRLDKSYEQKYSNMFGKILGNLIKPKNDVMIPYQLMDRSAKDFADLLFLYISMAA